MSARMARALDEDADQYRELLDDCRALLERHHVRFLARIGKGPGHVEDLVQETLIALYEKRHTYDREQPFLPWLFAIARYKAIDFGRRQRVRAVERGTPTPENFGIVPADGSIRMDVRQLLDHLPERQRRALALVKLEGWSIEEAARALGVSDGATRVVLHRAVRRLRQLVTTKPDER